MTCAIGYSSEYIKGCDIAKFGEGCETCVSLFQSSWVWVIITVAISTAILGLIITKWIKKIEGKK